METRRITYLSALVLAPTMWALACGGSDNPQASNAGSGGSSSGNGGSATGNGGSSSGNGGSATGNGGSSSGNGGTGTSGAAGSTGGRGFMIPMETIVPDPTCPDRTFTVPDGGNTTLPDGGMVMIPPGLLGDGGSTTLKGCCDQTGVCGVAFVNSFTVGGMAYNISICATPADVPMGSGFDAGPTKSCTYVAP